jgi:hypothetical protein
MKTYLVTQVVDWGGKPLSYLVQMSVEARSPKHAIQKVAKKYKFPEKMFSAVLQKERTN